MGKVRTDSCGISAGQACGRAFRPPSAMSGCDGKEMTPDVREIWKKRKCGASEQIEGMSAGRVEKVEREEKPQTGKIENPEKEIRAVSRQTNVSDV